MEITPHEAGRVSVLLPYPFAGPFDYRLPRGMALAPGDHVLVPLNRREEVGVVWDSPPDAQVGDNRLRPVSGKLDAPPMREDLRRLIDWIAAYTVTPPGEVLGLALRVNALRPDAPALGWVRGEVGTVRLTAQRQAVLTELERQEPRATAELATASGVSTGVVRGMADAGLLKPAPLPMAGVATPDPAHPGPTLSQDQRAAADALCAAVSAREFSVTLLEGVTGSGKTEVSQEAIAQCLREGRQALVLLPEIALSAQSTQRFAARFGAPPALCNAPAVLASATPSLESIWNVEAGRYRHLVLPSRHGGASMPAISLVDLREAAPERGDFLSPVVIAAIRETLARGEQAMLFLNRRGYAPLTLCRRCGHRMACPNCTAWLVEHRARRQLACHHCGHTAPIPPMCPACSAADSLAAIGPGVERITEEAQRHFPGARLLVMASDTLTGPNAAAEAARAVAAREVELVIGTQIVAKGWHFPHLTLVGVVDADLGLAGGDLRAAERTVQLLHQVSGRAGRAEAPGRVLLQTFNPDHPVMQALLHGDIAAFRASEQASRSPGNWPPYGRLAALIVSADTAEAADATARALGMAAPEAEGVVVLGPAPAPLAVLRGRHRRRLLLKARRDVALQKLLRAWMAMVPISGNVRVDIDVDPVSFL